MDYTGRIITKNPQTPSANGAPGIWTLDEAMQYSKQGKWPPGYQISRSVRLRSSASAYFNRTLTTPTNNKIWTWSGWVKRGSLSNNSQGLFEAPSSGSTFASIYFTSGDIINWYDASGGATVYILQTTQVFRDPSAWYHIVCAYDSTQATSTDRQKMYVNGVQITAFSTATYVAQNTNGRINSAVSHKLGTFDASSNYLDGYLTEINFIDGQQLTPASFGYFDTYTGVWQPAPYTGTYGTNGFYLTFADNSAATATTIGKDYSGNGNNWTPNNISVTNVAAPNTNDSMVDVPINWGQDTGVGGEVRGNYAVISSVTGYAYTSSNGNLTAYGGNTNCYFSMPVIGKMYFEVYSNNMAGGLQVGFVKNASIVTNTVGYNQAGYYGVNYATTNSYWVNGSYDGLTHGTITNQTMKFAVDGATGKVWIGSGSTWFNSGDPANGTSPAFTLSLSSGDLIYPMLTSASSSYVATLNAGQQPFGNAAPSGFKAMCTQNMALSSMPTILNGANYMAATLYTGNGGTLAISNAVNNIAFQPDLVWVKSRSAATDHKLTDSVRGTTKALISDTTGAETTDSNGLTAFGTGGFTLGSDTVYNNSGATYVGWQWKASGSTVSNTSGSITSTVSANTTAGFSIVTYTGNGTVGATVGHGLGVTPGMVIVKSRSATADWPVKILPYMTGGQRLELSTTNAITTEAAGSGSLWNATNPNSTVITLGNQAMTNTNGTTYVAYCFAPISGYSAFGTWTNNNSTSGTFTYLGFRPRFILLKNSDNVERWFIFDSSRQTYNIPPAASSWLVPNSSAAEGTNGATTATIDLLSNGFKIYTTDPASGEVSFGTRTYIYAAFAENPFTIARAR